MEANNRQGKCSLHKYQKAGRFPQVHSGVRACLEFKLRYLRGSEVEVSALALSGVRSSRAPDIDRPAFLLRLCLPTETLI